METNEKINIAELLKDCPSGTKLYSPIFGDVYLEKVRPHLAVVVTTESDDKEGFLYDGRYKLNGECCIFPSNENRDWSTFQRPFKDGDVVTDIEGAVIIYKGITTSGYCGSFVSLDHNNQFIPHYQSYLNYIHLATEEEKAKLFQAIKDNGYKWDAKSKTLEKLIEPKFKVGDIITDEDGYKVRITEVNLEDECYGYESMIAKGIGGIGFSEQENWELVPNKFDIANLKPFYKVLVRPDNRVCWECDFFSSYDSTGRDFGKFHCVGGWYKECIPYEGNEHLLGTTNDCSDFYKTWE